MVHDHTHDAKSLPLKERLREAEACCVDKGEKLTPLRRKVLELILKQGRAVKAYDLIRLISTAEKEAKPPTIYRSLDFLLKVGLIHRVAAIDAFMACSHPHHGEASQLLICGECGDVEEVESDNVGVALRAVARSHHFRPDTTIEIPGLCSDCQKE